MKTNIEDTMKTNILVQYRGGGYSGCSWEWNYFYIDKQGTFHDIQSSGCAGIDNMQDAEQFIEQNEAHTYIYDMGSKQDIEAFSKECNAVHVTGVLQWFEDYNSKDIEFFAVCSKCGCKMIAYCDIALENDLLLCQNCYFSGYCNCCESYVGDTEIVQVDSDEHHDFDYICSDCKKYHDNDREIEQWEIEQLEDLRWQAFCTGTPDMFSGELRDARIENRTGEGCYMSIKDNYPDGICPDCSLDIPSDAIEGSECVNCGHVFCNESDNYDIASI